MSTYLEIQQRVANDYLNRSDYGSEVKRSILQAIRFYEQRRWRFNQTATSIACSSGQSFVTLPSNFLVLDHFRINITGGGYEFMHADFDLIQQMRASSATGTPTHFNLYGNRIELAVIPDSAYSCPLYYIKSLTELSADGDTNSWITGGMQDVIAHHATKLMWANVIRNEKEAAKHATLEADALSSVTSGFEQFASGKLRATEF